MSFQLSLAIETFVAQRDGRTVTKPRNVPRRITESETLTAVIKQ